MFYHYHKNGTVIFEKGIPIINTDIVVFIFAFNAALFNIFQKKSEYNQEMPQSHTADQPTAPRRRDTEY